MAADALPSSLLPMKAVAGPLPDGPEWSYEVKWDGMRALLFVEAGDLRVRSASGRDVTVSWPELRDLPTQVAGHAALLDGELVATDERGIPSFGRLQQRMHIADATEARRRAGEVPVTFMAFDLLHLSGHDLLDLPLTQRRELLHRALDEGPHWQRSPVHDDGPALLAAATERGLEGVMAKQIDSTYQPGARSRAWRKVKVRQHQELVVGGWLPGEGTRAGQLGALLVGYHDPPGQPGPLRYAGRVGTGFTDRDLERLRGLLGPLATDDAPFDPLPPPRDLARGVTWVRPELVAEVAFGEWTSDDRLRHPSYLGLRTDKHPDDVGRAP